MEFLKQVYARFNARDIEAVLAALHADVTWANGMEGGHVHGREAVRSYWTRQWAAIDPRVEPAGLSNGPDGEIVVEVHQTVVIAGNDRKPRARILRRAHPAGVTNTSTEQRTKLGYMFALRQRRGPQKGEA